MKVETSFELIKSLCKFRSNHNECKSVYGDICGYKHCPYLREDNNDSEDWDTFVKRTLNPLHDIIEDYYRRK